MVVLGAATVIDAPGALAEPAAMPCTASASACVDLVTQQAWLLQNGSVIRGPVAITSGGPGQETPTGDFKVDWKDPTHISSNKARSPMPYSVFFAAGGVALHGGKINRASAGCVHLAESDAIAFYENLKLGDQVQVRAPEEEAAHIANRAGDRPPTREPNGRDSARSGSTSAPDSGLLGPGI